MYLRCVLLCNYCASQGNAFAISDNPVPITVFCSRSRNHSGVLVMRANLKCKSNGSGESNFCEGKAKKREARDPSPPYKAYKGAKYGIPDSSCRRISDGALRADHRRLPETAGMVTAFEFALTKRARHGSRGNQRSIFDKIEMRKE
jgi:hypothetical protein